MQCQTWLDEIACKMRANSFSERTIQRLTDELADHYLDLMEEKPMSSMTHEQIVQRLGTSDSILKAAESHRRDAMPWLYYLTLPFFATLLCLVATTATAMLCASVSKEYLWPTMERLGVPTGAMESSVLFQLVLSSVWAVMPIVSALLASILVSRLVARRDNRTIWIVTAFVIIACLSAPVQNILSFDERTISVGMNVSLSMDWFLNGFRIAQIVVPMIVMMRLLNGRRAKSLQPCEV